MIGQTISHYKILEKLGRGGMGVVYKAQDSKLDRVLALKFLPQDTSTDADAKQRFIQEAKAASALDHPNICTIHDIGETGDGELYIVMAYYEGQTLGYRLEEETYAIDRAVAIITQLARALERAHEAGIIHRDIKPANIMVSDRGEVKLLDFGLAKLTSGLDLTRAGSTLGTAAYMSPEQAMSQDVDEGADIWAVGVVLYEMLAGRKPFESAYEQALMYSILNEDPVPIAEVRSEVAEDLAAIVTRCMAKKRADRFATMSDLLLALEAVGKPHAAVSDTKPRAEMRLSKRTIVAGIVGIVAIVLFFMLLQSGGSDSGPGISANRVAILPFSVRGSAAVDYLGEGMVDLLSEKLNGAGDLETVNPRVLIAQLKDRNLDSANPEEGNTAARLVGAGRYVTGDVLQVGDLIRLTAYAYETDRLSDPISSSTFEGAESDLLGALDGFAARLLSGMISGPAAAIQRAATSSSSLAAVKVYLSGEKALREGRNRDAAEAYRRAVELDSTFALAHYRRSIAADWIDAPYIRSSADKAMAFAENLPPRERSLLMALRPRRHGWSERAEQAYRLHLTRYLDDVEALVQFGELHFHENPRMGRSTLESRKQFERAAELEPGNLIAQIHLARLEGMEGKMDALRRRAQYYQQRAPDSERLVEVNAIIAFATGDMELQKQVFDALRTSPFYFTFYAVHGVVRYARDVHGAARLLDKRVSDDPLVLFFVPQVLVMKGQFGEYNKFMRSGNAFESNPSWDLAEAFIATSGAIPKDEARLLYLLDRLENADLQETRNTGIIEPHDDITEDFLAFENAYHRALILTWLDRLDEAARLLDQMKSYEAFPGLGSIREDVLLGLEAEIMVRKDNAKTALALLRQIRYEIPHAASVRAIADGTRSRYLRAELEYKIGDQNKAKDFYLGLDESWSPYDSFLRGPVYLRLAEIADAEGRIDDAIRNYERLLEMWKKSDPELIPVRESAQARILDLQRRKTAEPGEVSSPATAPR